VAFGDIDALREKIDARTGAVLLEPVQHEAGVVTAPAAYFQAVRRLCDEYDVMLILDEIKTGFGKTGRMFACQHLGIVPDLLLLGKSMGGGLIPMGAVVGRSRFWTKLGLSFPMTASSYAGNVLACAAALKTIDILHKEALPARCAELGDTLLAALQAAVDGYPEVLQNASGLGLLTGVQTVNPRMALRLVQEMIARDVLVFRSFGNPTWVTIEPPLVITKEHLEIVTHAFSDACHTLQNRT